MGEKILIDEDKVMMQGVGDPPTRKDPSCVCKFLVADSDDRR